MNPNFHRIWIAIENPLGKRGPTAQNNPTGLILGLRPANERRRYKVTPSLIGWAQTQNQPWQLIFFVI